VPGPAGTSKHKLTDGILLLAAAFLMYGLAAPGNLPGDTELRWSGGYAWSIRYQVPVLPFLVLPIASVLGRPLGRPGKGLVILLGAGFVLTARSLIHRLGRP